MQFCSLPPELRPQLSQKVGELLAIEGSHKAAIYDHNLWQWQFERLPSGHTFLFGVVQDGEIEAYYHVQEYEALVAGQPVRLGITHDVAVFPALRGQGVFAKLINYATQELAANGMDVVYALPNIRSFAAYQKYSGYHHVGPFGVWLLPCQTGQILRGRGLPALLAGPAGGVGDLYFGLRTARAAASHVRETAPDDAGVVACFAAFEQTRPLTMVRRSAQFLRWRFAERPQTRYITLAWESGAEVQAVLVLKQDEIFDQTGVLVMDFAYRPGQSHALAQLIATVRKGLRSGQAPWGLRGAFLVAFGVSPHYGSLQQAGFLQVPARFNPRPVNFFAHSLQPQAALAAQLQSPDQFHFTFADWDPF